MSHGGFVTTASKPADASLSPFAVKNASGNSSSQWKNRRDAAIASASWRYRLAIAAGSAPDSVRTWSDSAPKADAGTRVAGDENQRAHQRFATRFHLETAASGRLSAASAISFARTCSSVSFGPDASLKRTGKV